jgi:hypothetical protein
MIDPELKEYLEKILKALSEANALLSQCAFK